MQTGRKGVPRENFKLSGKAVAASVIGGLIAGGAVCVLLALTVPKMRRSNLSREAAAPIRAIPAATIPVSAPSIAAPAAIPSSNPMLLTCGTDSVPIIAYHEIGPKKRDWADLTTTEFAGQMRDLEKAGAHPVSIQDFYDHFLTGKALPDHAILLTFDGCATGQFVNALPVLEQHHFPAAFFASTDSIGATGEPDTADWEQLRKAAQGGLITIGSRAATGPRNLTELSDAELSEELERSRKTLEEKLDCSVRFLAYPNGHGDARTAKAALDAGYFAALTMDRGWTASPAQTYFLPRFAPPRLPEILACWNKKADIAPPLPRYLEIKAPLLTRGEFRDGIYSVQWIAGGDLGTQSLNKRRTVGEMAREAHVQAALNGAFFSEIRLRTLGSAMMGPTLCRADNQYSPATLDEDARLEGRPLVLIGPQKCLILPYAEHLGHSRDVLQTLMPDVTDAFLAGGWIVHHGKAVSSQTLTAWSSHDVNDARHRVFAGIDSQHRFILGGTQDGVSTAILSKTLEKMGLEEAWLMDSGYSSALVWQNRILISGHNDRATPSRPVPHALFLYGDPAPNALPPPVNALPASGPGAATTAEAFAADMGRHHSKGRKRHAFKHRFRAATPYPTEPPTATPPPEIAPSPGV